MPTTWRGQQISFASEFDPDEKYTSYIWVRATSNHDTIRAVASRRGHPELAAEIAKLNSIRSTTQKLRKGRLLRLPGTLEQRLQFDVDAQDNKPPYVVDGYAVLATDNRPGRVGLTRFSGYNPIQMAVPISFESWIERDGASVEDRIRVLERMAGRGDFQGAAQGPPAVIRLSTTDAHGNLTWLLPYNYQWSPQNPSAPLWRIASIAWDQAPLRNVTNFRRLRQDAVVTVQQYTPVILAQQSAAARSKAKSGAKTG